MTTKHSITIVGSIKNDLAKVSNDIQSEHNKLTTISISHENYIRLKKLGEAGDSFNDVITEIFKKYIQLQPESQVRAGDQDRVVTDEGILGKDHNHG